MCQPKEDPWNSPGAKSRGAPDASVAPGFGPVACGVLLAPVPNPDDEVALAPPTVTSPLSLTVTPRALSTASDASCSHFGEMDLRKLPMPAAAANPESLPMLGPRCPTAFTATSPISPAVVIRPSRPA